MRRTKQSSAQPARGAQSKGSAAPDQAQPDPDMLSDMSVFVTVVSSCFPTRCNRVLGRHRDGVDFHVGLANAIKHVTFKDSEVSYEELHLISKTSELFLQMKIRHGDDRSTSWFTQRDVLGNDVFLSYLFKCFLGLAAILEGMVIRDVSETQLSALRDLVRTSNARTVVTEVGEKPGTDINYSIACHKLFRDQFVCYSEILCSGIFHFKCSTLNDREFETARMGMRKFAQGIFPCILRICAHLERVISNPKVLGTVFALLFAAHEVCNRVITFETNREECSTDACLDIESNEILRMAWGTLSLVLTTWNNLLRLQMVSRIMQMDAEVDSSIKPNDDEEEGEENAYVRAMPSFILRCVAAHTPLNIEHLNGAIARCQHKNFKGVLTRVAEEEYMLSRWYLSTPMRGGNLEAYQTPGSVNNGGSRAHRGDDEDEEEEEEEEVHRHGIMEPCAICEDLRGDEDREEFAINHVFAYDTSELITVKMFSRIMRCVHFGTRKQPAVAPYFHASRRAVLGAMLTRSMHAFDMKRAIEMLSQTLMEDMRSSPLRTNRRVSYDDLPFTEPPQFGPKTLDYAMRMLSVNGTRAMVEVMLETPTRVIERLVRFAIICYKLFAPSRCPRVKFSENELVNEFYVEFMKDVAVPLAVCSLRDPSTSVACRMVTKTSDEVLSPTKDSDGMLDVVAFTMERAFDANMWIKMYYKDVVLEPDLAKDSTRYVNGLQALAYAFYKVVGINYTPGLHVLLVDKAKIATMVASSCGIKWDRASHDNGGLGSMKCTTCSTLMRHLDEPVFGSGSNHAIQTGSSSASTSSSTTPDDAAVAAGARPVMQKCGTCKAVTYCSKTCQRLDWNRFHRRECIEMPEYER